MNGAETLPAAPPSRLRQALRAHPAAAVAGCLLLVIAVACVVGPWLLPHGPDALDWDHFAEPPGIAHGHYLGTDSLGRDILARTLSGGQISLAVGLVATLVSLVIGVTWGAVAGYVGGRVDSIMMRIVDVLYALPFMFFVILLMVFFGRHLILIFVAIGAINWLDMARIVRGQTLALKRQAFIDAARIGGSSGARILLRHIVPNLLGVVAVYVTLTIPQVMLFESFLSFLGLGVQEPQASWGSLVNEGAREMQLAPWALLAPASMLALTLFCFNFLGDGLRDALDPRDG
ncbi:ABC transporter permease subunit [Algiphilus sp. NNCM1]|nr:ABC transporter permease subunit [Algiphilus acroporae]MCI5062619.1 ABC transporter permease subunit [Algiphilus sp.]